MSVQVCEYVEFIEKYSFYGLGIRTRYLRIYTQKDAFSLHIIKIWIGFVFQLISDYLIYIDSTMNDVVLLILK